LKLKNGALLVESVVASRDRIIESAQGLTLFKRSHRQNFRIAALAVLALFIAQFGAIAHVYSHQLGASKDASTYQHASNSQEYCAECLNHFSCRIYLATDNPKPT
jgi:hypothetical protein